MTGEKRDSIRAIDRTIDVLHVFTFENTELSLAQICAEVCLPKTTVFRILTTLEQRNIIIQDSQTGKYRLGYEVMKMGVIAQEANTLSKVAHEEMEEISRVTGQTCNIYIRDGFERLCIAQVAGTQYVRRYSYLGAHQPLHCGAGKLLLAYASEDFQKSFFNTVSLERFTEKTVTDPTELQRELKEICQEGYSVTLGERDDSSAMVSVPLYDYTQQVVASITISGPISSFTEKNISAYIEQLQQAAQKVSQKMGFLGKIKIAI